MNNKEKVKAALQEAAENDYDDVLVIGLKDGIVKYGSSGISIDLALRMMETVSDSIAKKFDGKMATQVTESIERLAFDEAIAFLQGKVNLPTRTWRDIEKGMHARAFVIAGATKDELLTDLREIVRASVEDGMQLDEFRKQFDDIVKRHGWAYNGGRNWRTRVIFNTNIRTAYAAGRYKQMQTIGDKAPFWQYLHSPFVVNPRDQHLAWHQKVIHKDDPFWKVAYPPNGWGCQCKVVALTPRQVERKGFNPEPGPALEKAKKTLKNGRTVDVTEGIGDGWDYNIGEAAWGSVVAERLFKSSGKRNWKPLISTNYESYSRPDKVPADVEDVALLDFPENVDEAVESIRQVIGGDEKTYMVDLNGFKYPVYINAKKLGEHFDKDLARIRYAAFIPSVINNPFEVWMNFEEDQDNKEIVLRFRFIKLVQLDKNRALRLVLDAREGVLEGWTFFVSSKSKGVNKIRNGQLVYARD